MNEWRIYDAIPLAIPTAYYIFSIDDCIDGKLLRSPFM